MVGVVGGNLRAVGKEASDLESALIFRDLETKVTFWPDQASRDALLAFDGMPAAQIAQLINDESRQVQAEIDRERAAQLNRGGNMRSLTRRKELADAADETKQAVRDRLGSPVVVSERTVRR